MSIERSSPTLRGKELGARLRSLRLERGLTLDDVAKRLLCSTTKISRIESGGRTVQQRDVRDLCQLYEIGAVDTDDLMNLARESRQSSWWQTYGLQYGTFIGLEQSAQTICAYSAVIIPGLLQIEPYARELVTDLNPDLSDDAIASRVGVRMKRQEILHQADGPNFWAIVDELAFARHIGGRDVMAAQLRHLIEVSRRPNVHLQIIPCSTGAYSGFSFPFTLLEFSQPDVASIVYIEGHTGDLYLERAEDVATYRHLFNNLRSCGRGSRESRDLLSTLACKIESD